MTKRFRRILFYLLTALFFVLAAAAIFYSNGWRFDLETFSISKLGGIYFERIPDGATLTVEKLDMSFNPGFLKSSVLIANLFPKTYTARAVKDGYQTWMKQITVQPSIVTEIDPILMLPETPATTTLIAKNVRNFWSGPRHIITQTMGGALMFQSAKIAGSDVIAWSDDGQAVLTSDSARYFLINLNNPDSALSLRPAFLNARKAAGITDAGAVTEIGFRPGDSSSLVMRTADGLYIFDADNFSVSTVSKGPVTAFAASPRDILFSTEKSLDSYDYGSGTSRPVVLPHPFPQPVEIRYDGNADWFTLRNSAGRLDLVNREDLTSRTLAQNARRSYFAPDAMKLAFTTANNEIAIYTFGKRGQLLEKPLTEILHVSGENEDTITWHKNAAYLFLEYPDLVYLFEANGMPPINLQKIGDSIKKYSYSAERNSLYLLKNGVLSEFKME